jgi:predicted transposase YbfD/YdcC
VERTRLHRLSDILLLSLAAFCCGAEGFEDIEDWAEVQGAEALRRDFGVFLENGIPHHDTFRRVLCRLNPDAFDGALHVVRKRLGAGAGAGGLAGISHIALDGKDGKEVRGSHDSRSGSGAVLLLSAFATEQNLVLGQRRVDAAKTNEIPTAVEVLSLLDARDLSGAAVTADALHCQRATAQAVQDRGAHYLLAVKENQHALHRALVGLFETNAREKRLPAQEARTLDKGHGRVEHRSGALIRVADWLPEGDPLLSLWPGLTSVLCVTCERRRTHRGQEKASRRARYFISSSAAPVEQHMSWARGHWKVENSLHWCMDVTFGEDACRARAGHEAQNLATLRRVAAFLLKHSTEGTKRTSVRGRKKTAGWSREYLIRTLMI